MTTSCEPELFYRTTVQGSTMAALTYRVTQARVLTEFASATLTIALPGATEDDEPTPIDDLTDITALLTVDSKKAYWQPVWGGGADQMPLITERGTVFYVRWRVLNAASKVHKSPWIPWTVNP